MKHIFTAIVLTFTLLTTVFFALAAIFAYSGQQEGYSSLPGTNMFGHLNTDPAAITLLVTLSLVSLYALVLTISVDRSKPDSSTINWFLRTRMGKTARLIIGLALVIGSIAFSENIQGDSTVKDLGCAALCMLGLYLGFRNIGLSELKRRGCYHDLKSTDRQTN